MRRSIKGTKPLFIVLKAMIIIILILKLMNLSIVGAGGKAMNEDCFYYYSSLVKEIM